MLAETAAETGDHSRASRLAAEAEAQTRTIINPKDKAEALADLALAVADAGNADDAIRLAAEAETLARATTDSDHDQEMVLADVARAAARGGEPGRAEALVRAINDPRSRDWAVQYILPATIEAGDLGRAETLARTITNPDNQAWALNIVALAAAKTGDSARTRHLLALALGAESTEIHWWVETVSRFFPSAIKDAWDVLVNAFQISCNDGISDNLSP